PDPSPEETIFCCDVAEEMTLCAPIEREPIAKLLDRTQVLCAARAAGESDKKLYGRAGNLFGRQINSGHAANSRRFHLARCELEQLCIPVVKVSQCCFGWQRCAESIVIWRFN
ncbi:MAG: hypothetical protein GY844_34365, partial [Bradyrhizobium sp.]|nr:hypothetical protein [Bradyrhizobium sp.]